MKFNRDYIRVGDKDERRFSEGRPDRDTIITNDDILNLKILLNTEEDLEKLISLL